MANIYQLLFEQAMASGLPQNTPVILTVQWRVGLSIFDSAYLPPQEYLLTVADLQSKFVPPDSDLLEMIVVNTDILNIRPEPNTNKPRTGYLKRGDRVKVRQTPENNKWMELVEPQMGFASASYLQRTSDFA